eukprot:jgi/Tetstr1/456280/TSEL_043037.t1
MTVIKSRRDAPDVLLPLFSQHLGITSSCWDGIAPYIPGCIAWLPAAVGLYTSPLALAGYMSASSAVTPLASGIRESGALVVDTSVTPGAAEANEGVVAMGVVGSVALCAAAGVVLPESSVVVAGVVRSAWVVLGEVVAGGADEVVVAVSSAGLSVVVAGMLEARGVAAAGVLVGGGGLIVDEGGGVAAGAAVDPGEEAVVVGAAVVMAGIGAAEGIVVMAGMVVAGAAVVAEEVVVAAAAVVAEGVVVVAAAVVAEGVVVAGAAVVADEVVVAGAAVSADEVVVVAAAVVAGGVVVVAAAVVAEGVVVAGAAVHSRACQHFHQAKGAPFLRQQRLAELACHSPRPRTTYSWPTRPPSHLDRSVASEQEVKGEKEDKLAPGELVVFSAASAAEDKSARVREFYVGSGAALRLQELDTASAGLGHAVWASGLALAAFVSAHQNDFAGKRVLELGGGVCLPGLAAACAPRPPAEVALSDLSELLIKNAQSNIERNQASLTCKKISTEVINWDDCATRGGQYGHCGLSGFGHRQQVYDVILGADVVYNPANAVTLSHAVLAHLRDGGTFYMVCPSPSITRPGYHTLVDRLRAAGTVAESALVLEHTTHAEEGAQPACSFTSSSDHGRSQCPPCFRVFNFVVFRKHLLCLPAPPGA